MKKISIALVIICIITGVFNIGAKPFARAETNAEIISNLKNSSFYFDGQSYAHNKSTMIEIAEKMLDAGFEPAFVAGTLSNFAKEGTCGLFENVFGYSKSFVYEKYGTNHNYIAHMNGWTEWCNHGHDHSDYKQYSGKYIYNGFSLSAVSKMLNTYKNEGWLALFGLGCIQWSWDQTIELVNYYKSEAGSSDTITYSQCVSAEAKMITNKLLGSKAHETWKSNNASNLTSAAAAYDAGYTLCVLYVIPAEPEKQGIIRANIAREIYYIMVPSSRLIHLLGIEENTTWHGNAKFEAKRTDDDSNHYVQFYIDDNPITGHLSADSNDCFSVEVDTTKYADGIHKLSGYYANTISGNWDTRYIVFSNSIELCKIQLWGIDENSELNGLIKLWAKRFDYDPNHYAIFYIDDVPITGHLSSDADGFFSVEIDTAKYADGKHQLSIYYANTAAGDWDVKQIKLKNIISLQDIKNYSTWSGTVTIQAKRFDSDDNHYAIFYLDDVPITGHISADSNGFFEKELDTTLYSDGEHKLSIYYACTTNGGWDIRQLIFDNGTISPVYGQPDFILPPSVMEIEAYSFEGISAKIIYIPDTCTSIGKEAFKGCSNLTQIRIPSNCVIGTDAFSECVDVMIFGAKDSPAEAYAKSHANCTFVTE